MIRIMQLNKQNTKVHWNSRKHSVEAINAVSDNSLETKLLFIETSRS